jgi:CheY-like chemotaxis protein
VQPKRILIVEDNYDNRTIYLEVLRHAGYEVIEAVNGREGVERTRDSSPDLVLMDLSMPVMTGWEALAELRGEAGMRSLPVLALSAHVLLEGDYQEALRAGFAGYLTKPVEPKRVLEVVRETIGPPVEG